MPAQPADAVSAGSAAPMSAGSQHPAALGPLVRLTARGLLGRRRSLGVVVLAAAPVFVAAILAIAGGLGDAETLAYAVFSGITLGLVVPLAALILGTAALGTPIDDGTIVYLLVKPVPRRTVVLAAMLVAGAAGAALTGAATLLSGLLILGTTSPGLLAGMVAGALLASVLYVVVFVTLSVYTGRAFVVGLGYVLVWEGLVTGLFAGTRILSIREYALAVVSALGGDAAGGPGSEGVDLAVAAVLSVVVLVVAFVLGARRLGQFEVGEAG
jgi:ABC-2 type transport system permease protein